MADVSATLDAIERDYQDHFARRPRATRVLSKLDDLRARLAPLLDAAGAEGERARSMDEMYANEQRLVSEIQAGGATTRQAQRLHALSEMVYRRYQRHYVGQSRRTRDAAMLAEMVSRLATWRKAAEQLAVTWDHEVFKSGRERHAALGQDLARELTQVTEAASQGDRLNRARALATRANTQFRWYRLCFAEKERSTRRVRLLERLIAELADVYGGMRAVTKEGPADPAHDNNQRIVESSLKTYRAELQAVRSASSLQARSAIFGALANEANGIFRQWQERIAGRPFATVDLDVVADLCDQLAEVALHMDELDMERGDGGYEANLLVVLENLAMYEEEASRIVKARAT